jgi:hypothetical protein
MGRSAFVPLGSQLLKEPIGPCAGCVWRRAGRPSWRSCPALPPWSTFLRILASVHSPTVTARRLKLATEGRLDGKAGKS